MSSYPRPDILARVLAWSGPGMRTAFAAMVLCQPQVSARLGPAPPCAGEPFPPYPLLDQAPTVTVWSASGSSRNWGPPACTGWSGAGFSSLITTVGRFSHTSGADGLLRRIAATSELSGMRYWSTTQQRWQTLVVSAYALTAALQGHRRGDFTLAEMHEGGVHYFEQVDNLSGAAVYRLHVAVVSADRIVFDVENVSTVRRFLVTLFSPGEMQAVYFLERESDSVWLYYSILRTGQNSSRLAAGHESSSINRAVAFYRSLAGIPTDREPPAAR